ncbi:MAG: HAMP domain-containing protein [Hymenobacter sp.]
MVDSLNVFGGEVTRVARRSGHRGQARRARPWCRASAGAWKDADRQRKLRWPPNLTSQVRDIANVATAVARGDLSQKMTVDVQGEILELEADILNQMVDSLNLFAGEVTRVAQRSGHRGQAGRPGQRCPTWPACGKT